MTLVSVDGVRRSDLSVLGWAAIAAAGCLALWTFGAGLEVLVSGNRVGEFVIGGVLMVVLLGFAHSEAAPEIEGACANCGDNVRSQANRDGVDEVVEVSTSGSPRRASVGPLSFVVNHTTDEWLYCSGDCAHADQDRRQLIERPDGRDLVSSSDRSVTRSTPQRAATDGGQRVSEIRAGIEEHGSGAIRDEALLDVLPDVDGQTQTDEQGTLRPATEHSDSRSEPLRTTRTVAKRRWQCCWRPSWAPA